MPPTEEIMIDRKLIRRAAMLLCVVVQGNFSEKIGMESLTASMDGLKDVGSCKYTETVEHELTKMVRGY